MELFLGVVSGLLVLVFLVTVHELGHALAARRNGVVVEEFGVGFPPRAWGKKLKNGVLFTLNWLPLGGFVKLKGEHDSASKKGDYGAATYCQTTSRDKRSRQRFASRQGWSKSWRQTATLWRRASAHRRLVGRAKQSQKRRTCRN